MSLGLGDLKKKKPASVTKVTRSADVEQTPVAKPWSTDDLAQRSRSKGRKKPETADIAMNDDSPSLQAAPLFYLELAGDSRLAKVEDALVKIEERVIRALDGPRKAAQLFFPKFFAQ